MARKIATALSSPILRQCRGVDYHGNRTEPVRSLAAVGIVPLAGRAAQLLRRQPHEQRLQLRNLGERPEGGRIVRQRRILRHGPHQLLYPEERTAADQGTTFPRKGAWGEGNSLCRAALDRTSLQARPVGGGLVTYKTFLANFIPAVPVGPPYFEYETTFDAEVPYELQGRGDCEDLCNDPNLKAMYDKITIGVWGCVNEKVYRFWRYCLIFG